MKLVSWISRWISTDAAFPIDQEDWLAERIDFRPGRRAAMARIARRYHGWR